MTLPAFIRKGAKIPVLKMRKAKGRPWFRLPFITTRGSNFDARGWDEAAHGGYFGGYEVGEAMALLYLKHEREHGSAGCHNLTSVVFGFMARIEAAGGVEACREEGNDGVPALRGQMVGFLNTISQWATAVAKAQGRRLDELSEEYLLAKANAGLRFDHMAYMASLSDDDEEVTA